MSDPQITPTTKTNFERYKNYCNSLETTELYTEFSFYSLISACLQRRVWFGKHEPTRIYANSYFVFVGDPGTGKTVATRVNLYLLNKFKKIVGEKEKPKIPIAPDTISVEALIRKLAYGIDFFTANGCPHAQAAITFIAEELANLFKKDDQQLVKFLIQGYDGGDYTKELKGEGKINNIDSIFNMCINFLGATTPENMIDFMNKGLLSDGFLGRAIFIYGGRPTHKKTFFEPDFEQVTDLKQVEDYCRCLCEVCGEVTFSDEASAYMDDWYLNKSHIFLNEDRKLIHYYARKKINVEKLSIVNLFCRTYKSTVVEIDDVKSALTSLAKVELTMHLALASIGKNQVHHLSEAILAFLGDRKRRNPEDESSRRKTMDQLKMLFHSDGSSEQVGSAIEFLLISGRIKAYVKVGSMPVVLEYESNI